MANEAPTAKQDSSLGTETWGDVVWEDLPSTPPAKKIDVVYSSDEVSPEAKDRDALDDPQLERESLDRPAEPEKTSPSESEKITHTIEQMRQGIEQRAAQIKEAKEVVEDLIQKVADSLRGEDDAAVEKHQSKIRAIRQNIKAQEAEIAQTEKVLNLLQKVSQWGEGELQAEKIAELQKEILDDYGIALVHPEEIEPTEEHNGEDENRETDEVPDEEKKFIPGQKVRIMVDGKVEKGTVTDKWRKLRDGRILVTFLDSNGVEIERNQDLVENWQLAPDEAPPGGPERDEDYEAQYLKVTSDTAIRQLQADYEVAIAGSDPSQDEEETCRKVVGEFLASEWDKDRFGEAPDALMGQLMNSLDRPEAGQRKERKLEPRDMIFNVKTGHCYWVWDFEGEEGEQKTYLEPVDQDGDPIGGVDWGIENVPVKDLEQALNMENGEWRWMKPRDYEKPPVVEPESGFEPTGESEDELEPSRKPGDLGAEDERETVSDVEAQVNELVEKIRKKLEAEEALFDQDKTRIAELAEAVHQTVRSEADRNANADRFQQLQNYKIGMQEREQDIKQAQEILDHLEELDRKWASDPRVEPERRAQIKLEYLKEHMMLLQKIKSDEVEPERTSSTPEVDEILQLSDERVVFSRGRDRFEIGEGWRVRAKHEQGDKVIVELVRGRGDKEEVREYREGVLEAWMLISSESAPHDQESAFGRIVTIFGKMHERTPKLKPKEAKRSRNSVRKWAMGALAAGYSALPRSKDKPTLEETEADFAMTSVEAATDFLAEHGLKKSGVLIQKDTGDKYDVGRIYVRDNNGFQYPVVRLVRLTTTPGEPWFDVDPEELVADVEAGNGAWQRA